MPDLKAGFTEIGGVDVVTYLNGGNVIFSMDENDEKDLTVKINKMIQERFDLDIPVFVIKQQVLKEVLNKAPDWWGMDNKEIYDNLIFVMPVSTAESIAKMIGEPTKELEQVFVYDNAIFWSFDRVKYSKANWWKKTASPGIGELLTIRTANTLRKIVDM